MRIIKINLHFVIVVFSFFVIITSCGKKNNITVSDNLALHVKYGDGEPYTEIFVKGQNAKLISRFKHGEETGVNIFYFKDTNVYFMSGEKVTEGIIFPPKNVQASWILFNSKEKLKDYIKKEPQKIIGYDCDVYIKGGDSIWVYKDKIVLKVNKGLNASLFETDDKIKDDFFNLPSGVKFVDSRVASPIKVYKEE